MRYHNTFNTHVNINELKENREELFLASDVWK